MSTIIIQRLDGTKYDLDALGFRVKHHLTTTHMHISRLVSMVLRGQTAISSIW